MIQELHLCERSKIKKKLLTKKDTQEYISLEIFYMTQKFFGEKIPSTVMTIGIFFV